MWDALELRNELFCILGDDPTDWLFYCANYCTNEEFQTLLCGLCFIWIRRNGKRHDKQGCDCYGLAVKVKMTLAQIDRNIKV